MKDPTRWLASAVAGVVLGMVSLSWACARAEAPAAGSAAIGVETSQLFITVRNQSGQALNNVKINIVPVGGATLFSETISRLESGEKRDLSLSQFHGRDGTPFNLRVVRTKSVQVSGTNVDGKTVEVEVPWR